MSRLRHFGCGRRPPGSPIQCGCSSRMPAVYERFDLTPRIDRACRRATAGSAGSHRGWYNCVVRDAGVRCRSLCARTARYGARAPGPRRCVPGQALRNRDRNVRHGGRGRRLRAGQSAAQAGAGRLHPARLQRARARHFTRAPADVGRRELAHVPDLRHVVRHRWRRSAHFRAPARASTHDYAACPRSTRPRCGHRVIDTDMAAILYTSGSTGRPKGVVLSHRNMVAGAKSVASYLENSAARRVARRAAAVVRRRLQPAHHGVPRRRARRAAQLSAAARRHQGARAASASPGSTAVPPLWIQLAQLDWPAAIGEHLRYFANTGGRMPRETLTRCARRCRRRKPFLMYGLTEAFRSTYLPPEEVDRRPDSIGKAIPNAEILVLRDDGTPCAPNEPGELVHRGALVALGYWNDRGQDRRALQAAARARAAGPACCPRSRCSPATPCARTRTAILYFVGRRDEMIKTSGYRVSPTEIEEVAVRDGARRRSRRLRRRRIRRSGRRSSSSRRLPPARRVDARRAARRVPRAAAGLHGAGRHRRRATVRCRATPTARSTARRSLRSCSDAVRRGRAMSAR